ncbi:PrimPol-like protein 2 [Novymonas esmeraldas]|uniref:PrimPol-like protein 2 n=1 Tax=Novymonas esmeraldas TaxID=1808958 RepID=A0AAW0EU07_9TRYP
MSARKVARVEAPATGLHAPRVRHDDGDDSDDDVLDTSVTPLFLLSGPRGGAINPRSGDAELTALADAVDETVFHVLRDAWAQIGVPADRYWRCPQRLHHGGAAPPLSRPTPTLAPAAAVVPRLPDPAHLHSSFYATRVEALAARGYGANRGLVPIALDRRGGTGSKAFNVLPAWNATVFSAADAAADETCPPRVRHGSAVAEFVAAVPYEGDRNLYTMVDEACPVDPYFDVDLSYEPGRDDASGALLLHSFSAGAAAASTTALSSEAVEAVLLAVLVALRREVESDFKVPVEECLVLTSSVQLGRQPTVSSAPATVERLKLSFHVHFRLADAAAVESVAELHSFMSRLRARLQDEEAAAAEEPGGARLAALLLRCVDFGVYSRWRAFRLPYNVKASDASRRGALAAGAGEDLLKEQLRQLGAALPDNSVGGAAPCVLQNIVLSADLETCKAQQYLVERLEQHFRFLLPLLPGATSLTSEALLAFLTPLVPPQVRAAVGEMAGPAPADSSAAAGGVVSAWVMELGCIVRDASALPRPPHAETSDAATSGASLRLLRSAGAAVGVAGAPLDATWPPRPQVARVRVDDPAVKRLLAEVFWCLAPEYGTAAAPESTAPPATTVWGAASKATPVITAQRIGAHYEDAIRAYYVTQKQSRYCIRQRREHRSTFAQLYLTFGSIKIRCYSNDCCARCCVIPWEAPKDETATLQHHPGYPMYERLVAIRAALFPPLPAEELVRRYGASALSHA